MKKMYPFSGAPSRLAMTNVVSYASAAPARAQARPGCAPALSLRTAIYGAAVPLGRIHRVHARAAPAVYTQSLTVSDT